MSLVALGTNSTPCRTWCSGFGRFRSKIPGSGEQPHFRVCIGVIYVVPGGRKQTSPVEFPHRALVMLNSTCQGCRPSQLQETMVNNKKPWTGCDGMRRAITSGDMLNTMVPPSSIGHSA